MYKAKNDPNNLYGPMSRKCSKNGYKFGNFDKHNIILTGLSMTSKNLIDSFVKNFDKYSDKFKRNTWKWRGFIFQS